VERDDQSIFNGSKLLSRIVEVNPLKVVTVVGTRPELIRLSRVINRLDNHFEHILIHTGQNFDYELNQIFFEELEIRQPDYFLEAAGGTSAQTIAKVIETVDVLFEKIQPDALLILGDTNSGLCVIPAKRRHIPIFHMEAGNRCFDLQVPEEINRKIIDHLSDVNLPYTENARRNLLEEGLPTDQIFVTGSPLTEVVEFYRDKIDKSKIVESLGLEHGKYFVASFHREENVDNAERLDALFRALNAVVGEFGFPVVLSVHPRTRKKMEGSAVLLNGKIQDLRPLGFFDYVKLQQFAHCVLSDSGTITEESAILGFPAVTLRDTHERPEGMDSGVLVMTGVNEESIIAGIKIASTQYETDNRPSRPVDYNPSDVSWKVTKLIQSYVPYVQRRTWSNS
jgi:UDP-N-acetylglucosamine 2-epimerase